MPSQLLSSSEPFTLAIPPPRPVSVNSLAREPISAIAYPKSSRSTSAEIQLHNDESASSTPLSSDSECQSPMEPEIDNTELEVVKQQQPEKESIRFEDLPIEIHEVILDSLFGERTSAFTRATSGKSTARSWTKALRHPRRKALSNLSLICRIWTALVQERIYRHIKIKGTVEGLSECAHWFDAHLHLAPYVRHIEFWVPVWGNRTNKNVHQPPARRYNNEDVAVGEVTALLHATMSWDQPDHSVQNHNFHYASHNATLEEIFFCVYDVFPDARILTLEGGHCKKPPMIRHFKNDPWGHSSRELIQLPNIHTFVMRGAWNIMRDYQHWRTLSNALPSLREWDCAYAKPKIEGYDTIARVLQRIPSTLRHLNISLEGFYNKETGHSPWFVNSPKRPHLCSLLGDVAPHLESLTFTGKVCSCLFAATQSLMANSSTVSKLKSLDLVVKSCCRDPRFDAAFPMLDDVSGITNLKFIAAFERLIVGAVRTLENHHDLSYLRIRFIDLDSACPLLNPYFQMVDNECTGIWSQWILNTLNEARPMARFLQLNEGIYPQYGPNRQIVGAVYPRTRPTSIHAYNYRIIADASKP